MAAQFNGGPPPPPPNLLPMPMGPPPNGAIPVGDYYPEPIFHDNWGPEPVPGGMNIQPNQKLKTNKDGAKDSGPIFQESFEGFVLRKAIDFRDKKGNWSRVIRENMGFAQSDLSQMCKDRKDKTKKTPLEQMTSDSVPEQRQLIERILGEKNHSEKNPAAEWVLAFYRKDKKSVNKGSFFPAPLTTTAIRAIVKRQNKDKNLRASAKWNVSSRDDKRRPENVGSGVIMDLSEPMSTKKDPNKCASGKPGKKEPFLEDVVYEFGPEQSGFQNHPQPPFRNQQPPFPPQPPPGFVNTPFNQPQGFGSPNGGPPQFFDETLMPGMMPPPMHHNPPLRGQPGPIFASTQGNPFEPNFPNDDFAGMHLDDEWTPDARPPKQSRNEAPAQRPNHTRRRSSHDRLPAQINHDRRDSGPGRRSPPMRPRDKVDKWHVEDSYSDTSDFYEDKVWTDNETASTGNTSHSPRSSNAHLGSRKSSGHRNSTNGRRRSDSRHSSYYANSGGARDVRIVIERASEKQADGRPRPNRRRNSHDRDFERERERERPRLDQRSHSSSYDGSSGRSGGKHSNSAIIEDIRKEQQEKRALALNAYEQGRQDERDRRF